MDSLITIIIFAFQPHLSLCSAILCSGEKQGATTMGCVTSKVMTKTGSFREELSRSLKKRYGTQDLLISTSRKCDGDEKEGNKLEPGTQHLDHETINMWDLMVDLEEEQVDRHEERAPHEFIPVDGINHTNKHSQSLRRSSFDHKINEHGVHDKEKTDLRVRSRSFHTVDEYDAIMMERNGWSHYKQERKWEDKLEHTANVSPTENIFDMGTKANSITYSTDDVNSTQDVRRIRRPKDLASLVIPSTIEFPVAANLIDASAEYNGLLMNYGDHDYYVTPKFGNFGLPIQANKYKCSLEEKEQESVFDQELLSSIEVAMEQIQVEEEFILNQITKTLNDSNIQENLSSQF